MKPRYTVWWFAPSPFTGKMERKHREFVRLKDAQALWRIRDNSKYELIVDCPWHPLNQVKGAKL